MEEENPSLKRSKSGVPNHDMPTGTHAIFPKGGGRHVPNLPAERAGDHMSYFVCLTVIEV